MTKFVKKKSYTVSGHVYMSLLFSSENKFEGE